MSVFSKLFIIWIAWMVALGWMISNVFWYSSKSQRQKERKSINKSILERRTFLSLVAAFFAGNPLNGGAKSEETTEDDLASRIRLAASRDQNPTGSCRGIASRVGIGPDTSILELATAVTTFRTAHLILSNASRIRVVYSNQQISDTVGDHQLSHSMRLKVAVEGLHDVVPVHFNGQRIVEIPPGASAISDPIDLTLRSGSLMMIRCAAFCDSISDARSRSIPSSGFDCKAQIGEMRIEGDAVDSLSCEGMRKVREEFPCPSNILGEHLVPTNSAAVIGSSTAYGTGDKPNAPSFAYGVFQRALTMQNIPHQRLAVKGDSLRVMLKSFASRAEALSLARPNVVICNMGANDIIDGDASSDVINRLNRWWDILGEAGFSVVQSTFQVRSRSTDKFATLGGQSPDANHRTRMIVNEYIRSLPHPVLRGIWDVASLVDEPDGSGRWKVDGRAYGWTIDGSHLSARAHAYAAERLPAVDLMLAGPHASSTLSGRR